MIGSATDPAAVRAEVVGVDGVFHLAAIASVAQCNQDWHHAHLVNQGASVAVFEAR